jgi:hypothetical protein
LTTRVSDVVFDEPNLISDAGPVAAPALAEQIGPPELMAEPVVIAGGPTAPGANPSVKVMSLLAGMVAGADTIDDLDRLRHAGNDVVFGGSGHPPRWGPSYGRLAMGTCGSSTRCCGSH